MIDKETARALALKTIDDDRFTITDEGTTEKAFGWAFVGVPKRYLETRNIGDLIPGMGVIIVDRCDGSVHQFGSSRPPEASIQEYETTRTQNC